MRTTLTSLLFAAAVFGQETVRTANFAVTASDKATAKEFAVLAEQYRSTLAKEWFGQELEAWSEPALLTVKRGDKNSGATESTYTPKVTTRTIVDGDGSKARDSALPHEITHMLLSHVFRRKVPRWFDEGAAVLAELPEEQLRYAKVGKSALQRGESRKLSALFAVREYPKDVDPFYGQSYLVTDWLATKYGRAKLLQFVQRGYDDAAAAEVYGMKSVEDMEAKWVAYVTRKPKTYVPAGSAELGKKLFTDTILSAGGKVSCQTCHDPAKGYSSGGLVTGLDGKQIRRRPPGLTNCDAYKQLFWDGRAKSLEEQVLGPLTNPAEMGDQRFSDVLLRVEPKYGKLSESEFTGALADFMRSLKSEETRFDGYLKGRNLLSTAEVRGWNLFRGKAQCYQCHTDKTPFTDSKFHNTGAGAVLRDGHLVADDAGRAEVTGKEADIAKFKTPQLRGVKSTAPYMHDASLRTLEDVVEFYDKGGVRNKYLDKNMFPLGLSAREKADLVAFLRSL